MRGDTLRMTRSCRRGHELIPGVSAYAVTVWTWCKMTYCRRPHGEDANTRWNPDIGRLSRPERPGAWEHRRIEWRCKVCNRDRVRQWRNRTPVIGGRDAPNYTGRP